MFSIKTLGYKIYLTSTTGLSMIINTKLLNFCAALLLSGPQIMGSDRDDELGGKLDKNASTVAGRFPQERDEESEDYVVVDIGANQNEGDAAAASKSNILPIPSSLPYKRFDDENLAGDGTNKDAVAPIKTNVAAIELSSAAPQQINVKKEEQPTVVAEDEPSGCCGCFAGLLKLLKERCRR